MIGSLIATGVGLGASLFGGAKNAAAMRKMREQLEQQKRENENWYNRRYNEDSTQRADAQRVLTMTEDAIRKRNKAAEGQKAVMGGNEASVQATKDANAQALADATAQIAVAGEQRKDKIENQYQQNKQNLDNQIMGAEVNKANQIAQATGNIAASASNLAGILGSGGEDDSILGFLTKRNKGKV